MAFALELATPEGESSGAIDDLSGRFTSPAAFLLLAGGFMAAAFPPFPGFPARLAAANAVLLAGDQSTVLVMVASAFLAGVGTMRVLARAWEPARDALDTGRDAKVVVAVGLVLVAASGWFLLAAPSRMLDWATKAAAGLF